jgi:hypothetical protein
MPRRIATYTASEWLKLRPLTQGYKTLLWDRLDRRYALRPPGDGRAFELLLQQLAGKNLVASVAFNSPWTIGWQLRFVGRHLKNATFLVADNSTDPKARSAIAALCAEAGVACLALPANPYTDSRHASRSHGLALNWIYRNVLRRLSPAAWGFFDHDLFPTQSFDPVEWLRGQPFYGHLEVRSGGRYLWPGYCLFARDADRDALLDFRQDWFLGLDTGGMNAGILERRAPVDSLEFAASRSIGPRRNFAITIDEIDWFDDCVHLGNASGWYRSNTEREPALDVLLQQIYDGVLTAPDLGGRSAPAGTSQT